jgi:amino acid transporter
LSVLVSLAYPARFANNHRNFFLLRERDRMFFQQLFAKKSLEQLAAEAKGENRLRRILGPIGLTSLGIGAIIGAGIFVSTPRAAAQDAGPGIVLSYVVAGLGCLFAALCYAEFASTTPVAGSAYTYAYATLGELFAWIIGWDLILEYAMACAVVAAGWTKYFDEFLRAIFKFALPERWTQDPFTHDAIMNLPAAVIILICTVILVIGIRESATTNAILVGIKVGVVLFVIAVGVFYVSSSNWTGIPPTERISPEDRIIPGTTREEVTEGTLDEKDSEKRMEAIAEAAEKAFSTQDGKAAAKEKVQQMVKQLYLETARLPKQQAKERVAEVTGQVMALHLVEREEKVKNAKLTASEIKELLATHQKKIDDLYQGRLEFGQITKDEPKVVLQIPKDEAAKAYAAGILAKVAKEAPNTERRRWGLLGKLGVDRTLMEIDDSFRSPFLPYGLSGIMLGAAIVFFAYIGFDAISTHSEEAKNPARDLPVGILASLLICTILYIGVAAVITGLMPYPDIREAGVAQAFRVAGEKYDNPWMKGASGLIATGALAGMTSVLLITFLSQARIFLAMARDGLLPRNIFAAVHPKFRTPHISTMLTGGIIAVVAALTPIEDLEEMVNIGTLAAFVIVCAAVLILRIQRPDAHRPFKAPLIYVVAPLGIVVNLLMMLFLPWATWLRLFGWLAFGLVIYAVFGMRHSLLGKRMRGEKVEEMEMPDLGHGH